MPPKAPAWPPSGSLTRRFHRQGPPSELSRGGDGARLARGGGCHQLIIRPALSVEHLLCARRGAMSKTKRPVSVKLPPLKSSCDRKSSRPWSGRGCACGAAWRSRPRARRLTCGALSLCRFIKKLEHTWKALVHDGVSAMPLFTPALVPSASPQAERPAPWARHRRRSQGTCPPSRESCPVGASPWLDSHRPRGRGSNPPRGARGGFPEETAP